MKRRREFDLVLLGATGFTGGLTAEYLAVHGPAGLRWAIAGRDLEKLERVRDRLVSLSSDRRAVQIIVADAADPESLKGLAERSRVLVSTVGPYLKYGEPVVAACASAGTDYLDLTGEPEFVDRVYTRYHREAVASGARLIHAAGFDSVPYDLGVLFTLQQLPPDQPIAVDGYIRAGGLVSGGTLESALLHLSRQPQAYSAARRRRAAEPALIQRAARARVGLPHYDRVAQAWVAPLPTVDPKIVAMSARLRDDYGPDFTYRHFVAAERLRTCLVGGAALTALAVAAQIPPLRRAVGRLKPPGEGPSADQRDRGWFTARFHATAGQHQVTTEVSGGDPAYGETAKMLAEAALCLAFDGVPAGGGQGTPAAVLGERYLTRLQDAGIDFRVLVDAPTSAPHRRRIPPLPALEMTR